MMHVLFLLSFWIGTSTCCSMEDSKQRTVIQRMHEDEIILFGMIVTHYDDGRFDMHAAEMDVFCVLKGPLSLREHRMINISESGSVPGMCHSTTLNIGSIYIVTGTLSDRMKNRLIPIDTQLDAMQHLQEASKACGLEPFAPKGVEVNMCPDIAGPEKCITLLKDKKREKLKDKKRRDSKRDENNKSKSPNNGAATLTHVQGIFVWMFLLLVTV